MIDILTAINGKPSTAIKFALDGLDRLKDRNDYRIVMRTFGEVDQGNYCCGCAATAAIQEIAALDLNIDNIETTASRALALGFSMLDLEQFEDAIDEARKGYLITLGDFCDIDLVEESFRLGEICKKNNKNYDTFEPGTDASMLNLKTAHEVLIAAGK